MREPAYMPGAECLSPRAGPDKNSRAKGTRVTANGRINSGRIGRQETGWCRSAAPPPARRIDPLAADPRPRTSPAEIATGELARAAVLRFRGALCLGYWL